MNSPVTFSGMSTRGDRGADQLVLGCGLERGLGVHLQVEGAALHQLCVGDGLGRIGLGADEAVGGGQVGGRGAQALGRAGHQGAAGRGTGAAQLAAALGDGEVGAGEPLVGGGGGVAHHHGDGVERHFQFLGGDLRHRGLGAGAQVDLADVDRDLAVAVQHQEGVDQVLGHGLGRGQGGGGSGREAGLGAEADDEGGAGGLQQAAAGDLEFLGSVHGVTPFRRRPPRA